MLSTKLYLAQERENGFQQKMTLAVLAGLDSAFKVWRVSLLFLKKFIKKYIYGAIVSSSRELQEWNLEGILATWWNLAKGYQKDE